MTNQLFLKPDEAKFLALAVLAKLEHLKETATNPNINWNPETRKLLKDMREAGEGLRLKLIKLGFDMRDLDPFKEGDQVEFLTKQS